ncbi:MAG: hypothetical protein COA78_36185 [Blastopirellula sp.]|nr:MAG: hypothetical protein COA78_36185 [Blastopirellula sp.]
MNESKIISWIESLTDKQFVDFFYRAVANRSTSDLPEWSGHFVLADAEKVTDEPWDVDFIALPDPNEYEEWVDNAPICQSGNCPTCGNAVRSVAKHVVCPVCNSIVYCT